MTITVIALVAVVMGLSTIAPVMQYAYASHGMPLPAEACAGLLAISDPPDAILQIIADHCGAGCPPNCGGGSVAPKTF